MVEKLPANAGDVGLITGPGRATGQLNPCMAMTEAHTP